MRQAARSAILAFALLLAMFAAPRAQDTVLVDLSTINKTIVIDLRYATTNNFLGTKFYPENVCYVRRELALKLDQAQRLLALDGLGLKIYDGLRPLSVQKAMWAKLPDARYIANPYKGGSMHNRGVAVDLTLIDSDGHELTMPTPFDFFAEKAAQFSTEPSPQERANRALLRLMMLRVGLEYIRTEWWHYQIPEGSKYPIIEILPY